MSNTVAMNGVCDPAFAEVRDVFQASFSGDPDDMATELGAAVAVYLDGKPVVDLWSGYTDETRTTEWQRDTIVCVQSVSKGVLTSCALMLVDRGLLDLDRPVAQYWPEFAQSGKETITVNWLLTHRAGLPAWETPEPGMGYDWDRAVAGLAASKPDLRPGLDKAYQPYTFGYLVGALIERVSGQSLREFLKTNLTDPMALDFSFGVPVGEDHRAATFTKLRHGDNVEGSSAGVPPEYADVMRRAINVLDHEEDYNSAQWRAAVIPAANGHTNGRAMARYYAMLACDGEFEGRRYLSTDIIAAATQLQWSGTDLIVPANVNQCIGFIRNCPSYPAGPNPNAFGHAGFGGAYGFADRENRLSFGYTPNKMWLGETLETGKRCTDLVDAAYRSLGV